MKMLQKCMLGEFFVTTIIYTYQLYSHQNLSEKNFKQINCAGLGEGCEAFSNPKILDQNLKQLLKSLKYAVLM